MISFLLDIDWLMLQQSCSVDEFWNVFSMKLNECIERFVPLRIVSCSKLPRLKHIRKLLLLKKKWYHKDRVVYKKLLKNMNLQHSPFMILMNVILSTVTIYPNYIHMLIHAKLNHTSSIPPLMKTDGSLAITDRDKCNVLNDYFASVFTIDNGVLPIFHPKVSCVQAYQQVVEFTYSKVLCTLKRLPSKYSRTPDDFPAGFLKLVASAIAFPLSRLFIMSMDCGSIPQSWKQAIVCPIFKKGSRKLPSNYRPVSLTSVCCKVMESIVYESMVFFLSSNSLSPKISLASLLGVLLVPNC